MKKIVIEKEVKMFDLMENILLKIQSGEIQIVSNYCSCLYNNDLELNHTKRYFRKKDKFEFVFNIDNYIKDKAFIKEHNLEKIREYINKYIFSFMMDDKAIDLNCKSIIKSTKQNTYYINNNQKVDYFDWLYNCKLEVDAEHLEYYVYELKINNILICEENLLPEQVIYFYDKIKKIMDEIKTNKEKEKKRILYRIINKMKAADLATQVDDNVKQLLGTYKVSKENPEYVNIILPDVYDEKEKIKWLKTDPLHWVSTCFADKALFKGFNIVKSRDNCIESTFRIKKHIGINIPCMPTDPQFKHLMKAALDMAVYYKINSIYCIQESRLQNQGMLEGFSEMIIIGY